MTTTDDNIARAKACGATHFHMTGGGSKFSITLDQLNAYTAQSIADAQRIAQHKADEVVILKLQLAEVYKRLSEDGVVRPCIEVRLGTWFFKRYDEAMSAQGEVKCSD